MENLNLSNIGNGAAVEKFSEELTKVIENILDPNTEAIIKREIIIKVIISPSKKRTFGDIRVLSACKLASNIAFETRAYFGNEKGNFVACEDNPEQLTFDDLNPEENIATLQKENAK